MAASLACPFTDADLSAHYKIRVDPGTGTPVVAEVALPSSVGVSGFYNLGTREPDVGAAYDDLLARVAEALSAVSPGDWTSSSGPDPGVAPGVRGYLGTDYAPAGDVTLYWDHADTTFDARWIGFERAARTEESGTFVLDHTPGRVWLHDSLTIQRQLPRRRVVEARALGGRVEQRSYGGWTEWALLFPLVPGPAVWASDLGNADLIAAFPELEGLLSDDPNFCFQNTIWAWSVQRGPVRLLQDVTARTQSHALTLVGRGLEDLRLWAKERGKSPPWFSLELEAVSHTP